MPRRQLGEGGDGRVAGGRGPKHFGGGLRPGPQRPGRLPMASEAPSLCSELRSGWPPHLTPSLGLRPRDQCSCPPSQPQPLPRRVWAFPRERARGCRLHGIPHWAPWPSPQYLCNYFCKHCMTCGCRPSPQAGASLSSRPARTSLGCSGLSARTPGLAVRPSQQRPGSSSLPKALVPGGRAGSCSAGGWRPDPWGRGPAQHPLPSSLPQAEGPALPGELPLFTCQMAPARVPPCLSGARAPGPKVSVCPSSMSSVQ